MVSLYLGWDGLGVVSFALVIYYESDNSLAAGLLTALSNRVGDFLVLFSIGALYSEGGWDFITWPNESPFLVLLILFARITKRAQIPFSAWLPAAIAAPTPVRALVHSSTLVTAGVYLLLRFNFDLSNQLWFFYCSCFTGLMAGLAACLEVDLKKIVALSTLSQLSIMIIRVSLNLVNLAFFHLIRHAFFKALLFICVGLIIHSFGHQDRKTMGLSGLWRHIAFTFIIISIVSLCGLFFLAGFFSKDLVFETVLRKNSSVFSLSLFTALVALSPVYSLRLVFFRGFAKKLAGVWISPPRELKRLAWSIRKIGRIALVGGSVVAKWFFPTTLPRVLGGLKFFIPLLSLLGLAGGGLLNSIRRGNTPFLRFLGSILFIPDTSSKAITKFIFDLQDKSYTLGVGWRDLAVRKGAIKTILTSNKSLNSLRPLATLNFYITIWLTLFFCLYKRSFLNVTLKQLSRHPLEDYLKRHKFLFCLNYSKKNLPPSRLKRTQGPSELIKKGTPFFFLPLGDSKKFFSCESLC